MSRRRRKPEVMTTGMLAKAAGVGNDTVRFYERAGLLRHSQRSLAGYRLYTSGDAERLQFIRRARSLGFSLDEIRSLLDLVDAGDSAGGLHVVAARRLAEIERHLEEITRIRDGLRAVMERSRNGGTADYRMLLTADAPAGDLSCDS